MANQVYQVKMEEMVIAELMVHQVYLGNLDPKD